MMSCSSRKKKSAFFVTFILSKENFFKICVLYPCRMYWINFQYIYTFAYHKTLLCKTLKRLQCILNHNFIRAITDKTKHGIFNQMVLRIANFFLHYGNVILHCENLIKKLSLKNFDILTYHHCSFCSKFSFSNRLQFLIWYLPLSTAFFWENY